jgi:integrase
MTSTMKNQYGDGSVYLDKKRDLWVAQVYRGVTASGRPRAVRKYAKTERQAEINLRALQVAKDNDSPLADVTTTVTQWFEQWLDDPLQTASAETVKDYRSIVRNYIRPHLGSKVLSKLTPADVKSLMRSVHARGLSARTVQYAKTILSMGLNAAVIDERIPANVAAGIKAPGRSKPEIDPFDIDEVTRILKVLKDDRLYALVVLSFAIGLRSGESYALIWNDVDLDKGVVDINKSMKRYTGKKWDTKQPKTAAGFRRVRIDQSVIEALRAHQEDQGGEGTDFVFADEKGNPLKDRWISRWWHEVIAQAEVRYRKFYNTRHTAATLMLNNGVPLEKLSKILGHASIKMTADFYAKSDSEDDDAAAIMGAVLGAAISDRYHHEGGGA